MRARALVSRGWTRWPTAFAMVSLLVSIAACRYGFAGGGLPADIRTVAVIPFENETISAEVPLELVEALRDGLERRLGLRAAPEARADLVVQGKIRRYEPDIAVAVSADRQSSTARRRVTVTIDIQLINQRTGDVLWQKTSLVADGEYAERAEAAGRKLAIDKLVNDVIEGAQSQWG